MAAEVTTTETEVVVTDAERARAEADAAATAAREAQALSIAAAADVANQAREHIARLQQEGETWRHSTESELGKLSERQQRHDEQSVTLGSRLETLEAGLASILSRLEPPTEPNPPNPDPVPPPGESQTPEPPPSPERKRAHRWT